MADHFPRWDLESLESEAERLAKRLDLPPERKAEYLAPMQESIAEKRRIRGLLATILAREP